jgi:hypothetical protein
MSLSSEGYPSISKLLVMLGHVYARLDRLEGTAAERAIAILDGTDLDWDDEDLTDALALPSPVTIDPVKETVM